MILKMCSQKLISYLNGGEVESYERENFEHLDLYIAGNDYFMIVSKEYL